MLSSRSVPVSVQRLPRPEQSGPSGLQIRWSTGEDIFVPGETLRKECPCATCQETRGVDTHSKPLAPTRKSLLKVVESTIEDSTKIEQVWPVGNYALGVRWGDKHDTGIFSFDLLRELCRSTQESAAGNLS